MSAIEQPQSQPPQNSRSHHLHGRLVAALWVVAFAWILIDPLTGTHSGPTQRWMGNIALLLVAAACTTLIAWLMQYLVIGPQNTAARSFELGWHAGRADLLAEQRPSLSVVSKLPSSGNRTGT